MTLTKLKQNLIAFEAEDDDLGENLPLAEDKVEVLCDSTLQALKIASAELDTPIEDLDYEILQKGSSGVMGIGKLPYKVLVYRVYDTGNVHEGIDDMNIDLNKVKSNDDHKLELNADGKISVKIYSEGIFLTVKPPSGTGIPADIHTAFDKLKKSGIRDYNKSVIENVVKEKKGVPIKIGEWVSKPDADSTVTVEIAPNEMIAYANISAPRPGGRHLKKEDVLGSLESAGVIFGYQEDVIEEALEEGRYASPIPAAKGIPAQNGEDGYIDYKVRIDKKGQFKEDKQGRIDFLSKDIVENVVQGQLLAQLIPPKNGQPGKTVTDKILPARDGKPTELKQGKGTILSSDRIKLTAEKNGQVIYGHGGKLNVEEVYTVGGDVGLDTGNIMFLGSVIVRGSVTDNMQVKAAGNIEVGGSIQKAQVEAEGDIIVKGGIQGRDEAKIESTAGSFYGKFVQHANLVAEKDILIQEAILHSKVEAVEKVICDGKRGQIVGGEILAGQEVRVKQLGAQASTPTSVIIGVNPKVLQQQRSLENLHTEAFNKIEKIEQNVRTLKLQKQSAGGQLPPEKEEMLIRMLDAQGKLRERMMEVEEEKERIEEYTSHLGSSGACHVKKTLYPGVTVEINGARFTAKDEYNKVTLVEERGNIKIIPFEEEVKDWRKRALS